MLSWGHDEASIEVADFPDYATDPEYVQYLYHVLKEKSLTMIRYHGFYP